ncbi:sulfotransferase family 2 domain-containing protein [Tropicimonas sediminicola]|uniref:Sulfotransferase family protein n=1 Tax=Tropicimonas sediminicola TaxID=1031541 RepID=A0A239I3C8_9RHOB|nr:sulfotransferase family 2 domain-containing protein [Tropicimonas sediminicola]SNS87798.1 Sulfotransferase family protein [Tropicimonas sediminicola]
MTVHLYQHGFSYISVPKCSSTSLKFLFFEIENGRPFEPYTENGTHWHIHNAAYPFVPFEKLPHDRIAGHRRVCVVREPVSRLLSCYANRVVARGDLNTLDLSPEQRDRGVVEAPDIGTFIRFLPEYRALSGVVAHHCEPLSHFLGRDPAYFDRIYNTGQVEDFVADLAEAIGPVPEVGRRTTSRSRSFAGDLTPQDRARIHELFAEDLEIFGAYM